MPLYWTDSSEPRKPSRPFAFAFEDAVTLALVTAAGLFLTVGWLW